MTKRDENSRGILPKEVTKMRNGLRKIGLGLVAVGLSIALLLTGTIPVCEAGPDEKVKIGIAGPFTGAIAETIPIYYGVMDHLKWLNEQGGINGVKVEYLWEDIGRSPTTMSISAHKRLVSAGVVVIHNYVSTGVEVLAPKLEKDGVPYMFNASPTPQMVTKPMWLFGVDGGYLSVGASIIKYFDGTWEGERPLRVAAIAYDYSSARTAMQGTIDYCDEQEGVEFVHQEIVPFLGTIDTTTEWLRTINKGPHIVVIACTGVSFVTLMKDCVRLGIKEKVAALCGAVHVADERYVPIVGEKVLEGLYMLNIVPTTQERVPQMEPIIEAARKYRGWESKRVPSVYIMGWVESVVVCEAIRLAIEKVRLENLNGHAVRDAIFSIKGFDTGLIPPITITENKPWVTDYYSMCQFQRGVLVRVSDWFKGVHQLKIE